MRLVFCVCLIAYLASGIERPKGVDADFSVADTDEVSRRNGMNLAIRCEMRFRPQRDKTSEIFIAQRELIPAQRQGLQMSTPNHALGSRIVEKMADACIIPG